MLPTSTSRRSSTISEWPAAPMSLRMSPTPTPCVSARAVARWANSSPTWTRAAAASPNFRRAGSMDASPPIPQGGHRRPPAQPHRRTRERPGGRFANHDARGHRRERNAQGGTSRAPVARAVDVRRSGGIAPPERLGAPPQTAPRARADQADADAERDGIHGSVTFIAYPEEEEDDEEGDEGDTHEDGL